MVIILGDEPASAGQFRLMLVEGIRGGIVAPRIRRVVEITGDEQGASVVDARDVGAGNSDQNGYETKEGRLSADQTQTLLRRVRNDISNLPRLEQHQFTDDLYEQDTRLEFTDGDQFWVNGAPEGCAYQPPNEQQEQIFTSAVKQTFADLAGYVKQIGEQHANEPTFKAALLGLA
ncbi:hypothetical protein THASP1DRAFT_30220 [Thamnocephalis sphaerospora]|uniref:Uncharacterized protein n=1 Tax=Thamnocephalis sphaerospora TaxID=78915 RepID=A0A4P9XPM5_9FUNG|nr:hypothetical protein THASP1DRAFT_30220 [Thamnocephalis sphaerospora]|eukprot:RKP07965.1 hypothetical protein THASP1DRAFT_30220 [Thamnocephalis sphaerospora]